MNYSQQIINREFSTLEHSATVVAARLKAMTSDAKKSGAKLTKDGRESLKAMVEQLEAVTAEANALLSTSETKSVRQLEVKALRARFDFLRLRSAIHGGDTAVPAKTAHARR